MQQVKFKIRNYSYMWNNNGKYQINRDGYVLQKDTKQIQIVVTEKVDGNEEVQFSSDLYNRSQNDSTPVFTVTLSYSGAGTVIYGWSVTGYRSSVGENFRVVLDCTSSETDKVTKTNSIYVSKDSMKGQIEFRGLTENTSYQAEMKIYIEDEDGTRVFQQDIQQLNF